MPLLTDRVRPTFPCLGRPLITSGSVGLFLFLLLSFSLGASPKRVDLSSYRPVTVRDSSSSVSRQGKVWIRLPVIPSGDPMLRFEIVTPPSAGTLSAPCLGSDGSWGIYYTNGGGKGMNEDFFVFRCQAPGRSRSDRAKVSISIIPSPPQLSVNPQRIDFGNAMVGESVRKSVILRNDGGTPAVGMLVLPAGIKAPEGVSFRLAEGEKITLPVEFSPSSEGAISGELSTTPFLGAQPVPVAGTASGRFSLRQVSPERCEILNASTKKLRVWLGNAASWGLPGELVLAPREIRPIALLATEKGDMPGLPSQGVTVSDGATTLEIPPPPRIPALLVEKTTADAEPAVRVGDEILLGFRIMNPGNTPREVLWKVDSKLGGGTQEDRALHLPPGGKESISYSLIPSVPGSCPASVRVCDGVSSPQTLTWNVTVRALETKPTPNPVPETVMQPPVAREDSSRALPGDQSITVPAIEGLSYSVHSGLSGKKTVEIFFPTVAGSKKITLHEILPDMSSIEKFQQRIEKRNSDPSMDSEGPVKVDQNEITGFRVIEKSGRVSILLKGAFPGIHSVQVSVWGENRPIAQGVIQVAVPDTRPFWMKWQTWLIGVGLLFALKIIRDRGIF